MPSELSFRLEVEKHVQSFLWILNPSELSAGTFWICIEYNKSELSIKRKWYWVLWTCKNVLTSQAFKKLRIII